MHKQTREQLRKGFLTPLTKENLLHVVNLTRKAFITMTINEKIAQFDYGYIKYETSRDFLVYDSPLVLYHVPIWNEKVRKRQKTVENIVKEYQLKSIEQIKKTGILGRLVYEYDLSIEISNQTSSKAIIRFNDCLEDYFIDSRIDDTFQYIRDVRLKNFVKNIDLDTAIKIIREE